MYDQRVTETDDVEFLLSTIGEFSGRAPVRVLEACCGSGRILVPLARAGHDATGFDADEFMLVKIPAKAAGLNNIRWRKADAARDDWGAGYEVVVLFANILYNITSDMDYAQSQELFIRKAADVLAPGGRVFIDYQPARNLITPDTESRKMDDCLIWEGADSEGNHGRMALVDYAYDAAAKLDIFTRRFELTMKNGETVTQDIPCVKHNASLEQARGWLAAAGLMIEAEYGGYDRRPIGAETERAIIIAKGI